MCRLDTFLSRDVPKSLPAGPLESETPVGMQLPSASDAGWAERNELSRSSAICGFFGRLARSPFRYLNITVLATSPQLRK